MLIPEGNGHFITGPLDAIVVLKDVYTGRFHVAFFEETPPPGPIQDIVDVSVVRLRSKMHHTLGADTIEGALEHLKVFRESILIRDCNVFEEPIEWNGELGTTILKPNWRTGNE